MVTRGSIIRTNFVHRSPQGNHNILILDSTRLAPPIFQFLLQDSHVQAASLSLDMANAACSSSSGLSMILVRTAHQHTGGYGNPDGLKISPRYVNESRNNQSAEPAAPVSRRRVV
jgi:hypothetical protein